MIDYVEQWARAFAFTLVVEVAIAFFLLPKTEPLWRRLGAASFAQVASHPAVWFIIPRFSLGYGTMVAVAELWAVASEVMIYRLVFPEIGWLRALGISALANGASFGLGLVVRALAEHFRWGLIV